jgi:uncharacterized membrane protein
MKLGISFPSINFIVGVIIAIAILAMVAKFIPASIKQYLIIS